MDSTIVLPPSKFFISSLTNAVCIAKALLAPNTRMEDLFFALYNWLDNHPTEAVLVSMNHEGGTGTPNDSALYEKLYHILNTPLAQKYWVQVNGMVRKIHSHIVYPSLSVLPSIRFFSWAHWERRAES